MERKLSCKNSFWADGTRTTWRKQVDVTIYFLNKIMYSIFKLLGLQIESDFANPDYRSQIPTKKIDGVNMPYLQVNMTDGTKCDLNEQTRTTRVLYVCYPFGKHEIYSLEETSTCEYEIVVLSQNLCNHPDFKYLTF
jgi:endoplasmic reticulum lectin 1